MKDPIIQRITRTSFFDGSDNDFFWTSDVASVIKRYIQAEELNNHKIQEFLEGKHGWTQFVDPNDKEITIDVAASRLWVTCKTENAVRSFINSFNAFLSVVEGDVRTIQDLKARYEG